MIAIGEYTISALNDLDYYEVTSSDSMVVIEDENFTPEAVTFTSKHRLGNGNLEAYSGRFKIETSKDGETWETKYTSSGNESTVEYELPSALEDKVPYLFRKSVGGDRAIEEIVGGSVVWNQLVQNGDFSDGTTGWRIYDVTYGSLSVSNGIATITYTEPGEGSYKWGLYKTGSPLTSETGHKFLAISTVKSDFTGQIRYEVGNNIVSAITLVSGQWVECPCICEKVSTGTGFIVKPVLANIVNGSTLQIKNVQLFDLTTMFGTQIADYIYSLEQSSAGSGIAKLRSWGFFTKDYYPYCLPTIRSVSGLIEKRYVGFNQWDEEWEVGAYNANTGVKTGWNGAIRSTHKLKCCPNTAYCLTFSHTTSLYIYWYDASDNYLGYKKANASGTIFTSPANTQYFTMGTNNDYGTTYNHDICINLSDPTKNGTYEPYEVNTYSLDSSLELRGIFKLDSNNNLYADGDIYPPSGNVENRYDIVDLGTLNYYYQNSRFECRDNLGAKRIANARSPILSSKYLYISSGSADMTAFIGASNTQYELYIYNYSYTDVPSFKAAMSGVYLLYEKATPTTSTALPFHNPQELSEYGTEEFVTTGIVPVGHSTKYPANIKNIRCSLYKSNQTPSATTLLDQITVPIVSGLQYQPFVQRTVFEWALSSSSTELDENTTWAEQKPKPTQAQPYLWERSRNDYSNGTHTYSDAHCDVTISGVISDVDKINGQITNKIWQSDITTSINSYDNTTVSTIRDRVSTTEQNLTGITTRVGAVESTTSSLGTRMTAAESSISQNADNIELKVSKDGVISSINQSSESITISADKVNIAGSTAFTSLNSQVTAIQNETNQKSELIRGTQTAGTYSWTGTSTTISQLTDGMEIRYWLPFSVAGGTVSGSYSYYDGSKTTTGTNTGVGLTLTLKDGTMTEEIPVYYGSMSRLTSHYGYGNIIRMIYRENVRVNNGNSTYYTVAKGFWCDANYDTNSNYVQYSTAVTSGATNGVYQYSLIMRDTANTWVSIATTNGTGTSKSAYTGGLYYDKVLYHSSGSNYASNKTTSTVYDSIGFDLRYSTNCGTTLTTRKPVYLVGTINNTDKRFYLDTTQWWTQTVPTSADGKTYIYIGEAYSSYQVWLATENKAYQYYNGRFITLEEIKDLEAMSWINSTGQNAATIIANWATDATSATTTINGGLIQTHTIQASHLATNAIMSNNYQASQNAGSPYSVTGSFLDLDNGNFYTPNFGLDNVNGNAYFNGEITATSGQIGDDTSNHWQIGTVVDFNGNQSAAIESNGTSYIQSGDWMISNDRIDTRHYDNQRKYTYLYEDGVYWDFGLHTPSLTSNNAYENNFIYIRNHESTIPTLEGAWNYVFRVDRNGMIYINGVSLDDKYASIDGVSGAYLPMTGGSLTGNLSVGGNLTVTGTVSGLKNLSINGKTYNGSSAVTVGTIGAAYGGTGQTSLINSANALINALDTGSSTPVDNDYYISQYVNGGATTKTYHRRPMSALWLYIKGKINADTDLYTDKFVPKTGGEFTGAVTVSDALIADEITSGNLIVNGVGRFTNGIYGDLTGNASTATVAAKVADSGNGQDTTFGYSKSGLSSTSDIAVWDGYELRKITPANLKTSLSLAKGDVGLGNVDNTADANKVVKGVSGIAGTANSNRHVWFSDTSPETSRNYDDDFMYNPSTNVLTVGSITGNTASATKLQTARNITIGNKTNSFDGSSAISYSLAEIGAVNKAGDTMTGRLTSTGVTIGNTAYNVTNYIYRGTALETVVYTKIKYLNSKHMPIVILRGYAYGQSKTTEIRVCFYIYDSNFGSYSATNLGAWNPPIHLFTYEENSTTYVAIGLTGSIYFNMFSVDVQDEMGAFNNISLDGWSIVAYTDTGHIPDVGNSNCVEVEYKSDIRNPSKVNGHTVNADVPSNAKFTDTTYTAATSAPPKVASASAVGSSTNYARQDHTHGIDLATGDNDGQVKIAGTNVDVKGLQALAYKASLAKSDVGLGNLTNDKQVKGLSSGTTSGHLVTWGSDGYTVADSGIAKGSVTTKITLSGSDYSASSNTITITKANLQSAVQDTDLVLMTSAERTKLDRISVAEGGTIDFSGVTASAPLTATVDQTTKAVNITHNTSGVTQGTYRSVTVNTYGHVTAGTNPTTLSGYGITDAKIASGVITLGSNTITPLTASSTLDATKLSGTASISTTGNAGTATEFSSNATITLTGDTTGSASSKKGWSIATKTDRLSTVGDNRFVGTTPNDYKDKIIFQGLKSNGYIGSPAGSTNYYSYLVGLRGWADSSGGKAHELAFNDNGIFTRMGSTTTWDSWRKLLDSSNYTDYTVTKTGTGASGTWGIDISGNAATATSATKANITTVANSVAKYSDTSGTFTDSYITIDSSGNLIIGDNDHPADIKIGAKNDNYGLMPNVNNYNQIGSSSLNWYRAYVTNYYGTLSHVDNWDSDKNIGRAATSSASSTLGNVNFYNTCAAGGTQTKTKLQADSTTASNITVTLPKETGTLALTKNYQPYAHYWNANGNNSGKYYKISINSYVGWMLSFTVRIYHAYKAYDLQISGYNYGTNHWYQPNAIILGASVNNSINVLFGYDSNYHLWVAIPAEQYTGIDVVNVTNGFYQVDSLEGLFTIEMVDSEPTTVQNTVTAYRPWYRNETVSNANNATNATTATNATNATNLLAYAGNEVTIGANSATSGSSTNGSVYINYRDINGGSTSNNATAITDYYFYNRKGSMDGVNVRAGTFVGSLSGTATKATQDGDGNTISSTYLKLSGGTMTGTEKFNSNFMSLNFRADNTSYTTGFFYGTNGNEALALATKSAFTSFMVVHGSDPTTWNTSTWTSASPTLQTKNNSLYVHELIPSGTTPTYNFKVNGTSYLGGNVRISDTNADTASCEMQYNRDLQCLEFIFN